MPSAAAGDTVVWRDAVSSTPARTGLWTHLAATYDADLKTLTLYVDGIADTSIDQITAFNDPDGPTWIGRSDTNWFAGDIADVNIWARALNDAELVTNAAPDPVAIWQLDNADNPAIAVDSTTEQNHGALTGAAAYITPGHYDWDLRAVRLNGSNAAVTTPQLLRTDQSFTVAAWARLARTDGTYTMLSQDGTTTGRFAVQWNHQCTCWRFLTADTDQANTTYTQAASPATTGLNVWTHLAAVYDAATGTLTLYVNGAVAATTTTAAAPWNATGTFTAGRSRRNSASAEWFPGDIDTVRAYQGALNPDAILGLSLN